MLPRVVAVIELNIGMGLEFLLEKDGPQRAQAGPRGAPLHDRAEASAHVTRMPLLDSGGRRPPPAWGSTDASRAAAAWLRSARGRNGSRS